MLCFGENKKLSKPKLYTLVFFRVIGSDFLHKTTLLFKAEYNEINMSWPQCLC